MQAANNNITVSLLSVNSQLDGDLTDNSVSTITNLDSNYDIVTLIINPDNYPGETSWEIFDANEVLINSGDLPNGNYYTEDICQIMNHVILYISMTPMVTVFAVGMVLVTSDCKFIRRTTESTMVILAPKPLKHFVRMEQGVILTQLLI